MEAEQYQYFGIGRIKGKDHRQIFPQHTCQETTQTSKLDFKPWSSKCLLLHENIQKIKILPQDAVKWETTHSVVKQSHLFKLFTNKCECFIYTFCRSSDCNNTFWTWSIWYVYFSTTLQENYIFIRKNCRNFKTLQNINLRDN